MKLRIFLVALILAAQVAGIAFLSVAREREWRNNPTFRLECTTYDPRDFLRGHYLPLHFKIENDIPFSKFDVPAQKKLRAELEESVAVLLNTEKLIYHYAALPREWDFWVILAPDANTGLWEIESVAAEDPKIDFNANPQAGKIALKTDGIYILPLKKIVAERKPDRAAITAEDFFSQGSPVEIKVRLDFPFPNRRFYLPEEKAAEFDKKYRGNTRHTVSAELFFRDDGTIVPKRLFIDGKEF